MGILARSLVLLCDNLSNMFEDWNVSESPNRTAIPYLFYSLDTFSHYSAGSVSCSLLPVLLYEDDRN